MADSAVLAGKSYPSDWANGAAPSRTLATPNVATCRSYPQVAMLYVRPFPFLFFSFSSTVLPLPFSITHPRIHVSQSTLTNPLSTPPHRSSNGSKTTPASGLSTATSPGTSRAVSTPTSWSGRPISKTCSSRRRRIRIVGIGRPIRAGICCRRSIRGCEGVWHVVFGFVLRGGRMALGH